MMRNTQELPAPTAGEQRFLPYRITEVELSQPIEDLSARDPDTGQVLQRAIVLVRLHTYPLGVVELSIDEGGLPSGVYADQIWQELGRQINEHLQNDSLAPVQALDSSGLPSASLPQCLAERKTTLTEAPFVSVLVATRDRPQTLGVCLRSILASEYPDFEIIVVDNAPSDETTAEFIRQEYPASTKVRYVREPKPGLACAHNRGLEEVRSEYVIITDDDVTVDRHWLVEMVRGFSAEENVGCVTGLIFPAEIQTEAQFWVERSVGYAKGFTRQVFDLHHHRPAHPLFPYAAGMFGSGANMAFSTEALRKIGGFDDGLGVGSPSMGGDDLASFFEVIVNGYALVYQPAAIIYHRHYREAERLRKQAYGYGVGLSAYLTKTVIDHPRRLVDFARRIPYGLYYALSARSPKNQRKVQGYPTELTRIERRGMLAGPFYYLRTRFQSRYNRKQVAADEVTTRIPAQGREGMDR